MEKNYLVYNDEMFRFLQKNSKDYTIKELVEIIKRDFGFTFTNKKLATYCLKKGFKYKYVNPKKSHSNKSTPIGTIVNKTDGGMLKIKTDNHKWEYLQRKIYEDYYGVTLPDDVYVIFLNQDKRDFNIKNLKAISRRESAIMARDDLFSIESRVTKVGNLAAKYKIKIKDRRVCEYVNDY